MFNRNPVYNLSAVLKETGLKADVLRIWERRYDLPKPQRSAGGHRLYSQYDIEVIKWLHTRQGEGLSIRRAVDLWFELSTNGRDPLSAQSKQYHLEIAPLAIPETRLEAIRAQWLEACLAFDSEAAEELLNQAFTIYPVELVCTEILQQGIRAIGTMWYESKASVQQEHFASAVVARRLEALILASPHPTRLETLLLACPAGELHTLNLLICTLFLRRRGWKVIYLGADVPTEELAKAVQAIQPVLIILAAQQLVPAAALLAAVQSLRPLRIPVAFGGMIFNRIPALRTRIPAWFMGDNLEQAVHAAEQLALQAKPYPGDASPDETAAACSALFREKRPALELSLFSQLRTLGLLNQQISEAVTRFSDELQAALELGDPALVEADLAWVNFLLSRRDISTDHMTPFLRSYRQAAAETLGSESAPITAWLDVFMAKPKEDHG
jgi:MerR family transcriptional regulator, light-induced transcriptional regulator